MAKQKSEKPAAEKRPRGRPIEHEAGFMRTTVTIPLDLLAEIDALAASWYVSSGSVMKRSEVIRACMRAMLAANRAGRLIELSTCKGEEELAEVLTRKLSR